jgi:hypothetical protein
MDSRVVNEKAAVYADRTIRLTPVLFDRLGLVKKSLHLKIEEFAVSCIPFDLSLSKASLLAFLSEKEVSFFTGFASKPQKFSVTWKSPFSSKPETFFLNCRIAAFRKADPASPYCFIDVEFATVPLAFKELMVGYFADLDAAEQFFTESADAELSPEQIEAALKSSHMALLKDGNASGGSLRIVNLSVRTLRVFGEFEGALPAPGEIVEFEPVDGDLSCLLKGECSKAEPSSEAPGFGSLSVNLQFSPYAHGRIRAAVGWGKRERKPPQ